LKAKSLFCDQICVLSSDPLPVFSRINLQAVEPAFFTCNGVLGLVVPIPTFPAITILSEIVMYCVDELFAQASFS